MARWLCHEFKGPGPVVKRILDEFNAHLYLLYFSGQFNRQDQAWTMDDANAQWRGMSNAYSRDLLTMNPLCSATLGLGQGGLNWRNLTRNQADQGVFTAGTHMPYAMWCLSRGGSLPQEYAGQHEGNVARPGVDDLKRFDFQNDQIVPVAEGPEHANILSGFKETMRRSILAQALAVHWLLGHEVDQALLRRLASLESDE